MKTTFDDLSGWEFEVVESTPGGYTVRGAGPQRLEVSFEGNEPDFLLARAKAAAIEVSKAAGRHLNSRTSRSGNNA